VDVEAVTMHELPFEFFILLVSLQVAGTRQKEGSQFYSILFPSIVAPTLWSRVSGLISKQVRIPVICFLLRQAEERLEKIGMRSLTSCQSLILINNTMHCPNAPHTEGGIEWSTCATPSESLSRAMKSAASSTAGFALPMATPIPA
jgi:hypothetical protein